RTLGGLAALLLLALGPAATALIAAATAAIVSAAAAFTAAAEHLHFVGHDLGEILLHAVLAGVFVVADLSLDVHLRSLAQVLAGDFRELAEEGHPVPLGVFLGVAVAVLAHAGGGQADLGDRQAALGVFGLRVVAEVADQDCLVDATGHEFFLPDGACAPGGRPVGSGALQYRRARQRDRPQARRGVGFSRAQTSGNGAVRIIPAPSPCMNPWTWPRPPPCPTWLRSRPSPPTTWPASTRSSAAAWPRTWC